MKNDIFEITSRLRFLELDKVGISYYLTDLPSDITLVFIPGWAGSIEFWYKQIAFFAEKFRVLVIDIPGFGHSKLKPSLQSGSPNDLSLEGLATLITKVILHEDIQSCVMVGHSIGGSLSLCAGAQIPEIVKLVIGADSFTHLNLYPSLPLDKARAFVESLENDFEDSVDILAASYFSEDSDASQKDYVCKTMRSVVPEPSLIILHNFLTSGLGEQLNAYNGPVYSIVSKEGFESSAFKKRYGERVKVIDIENTCHFIMLDKPNLFNDAIMKIMSDMSII